MTEDLAMMSRKSQNSAKRKATSEDKCFNYHKMRHCGRDCTGPDRRSLKKKPNKATGQQCHQKRNRAHIAAVIDNNFNIKPKPFRPDKAHMAKEKFNLLAPKEI